MRSIVRKALCVSRHQMQIAEAEDVPGALAELNARAFDLVFLDYDPPGLNGLEVAAHIKRRQPHLRVVLISSARAAAAARRDDIEFLRSSVKRRQLAASLFAAKKARHARTGPFRLR
ncbi:MAG TPA: response regulator [Pseudolabrys sp.]|nr:response regulator [Pseudolabrys sp.]